MVVYVTSIVLIKRHNTRRKTRLKYNGDTRRDTRARLM